MKIKIIFTAIVIFSLSGVVTARAATTLILTPTSGTDYNTTATFTGDDIAGAFVLVFAPDGSAACGAAGADPLSSYLPVGLTATEFGNAPSCNTNQLGTFHVVIVSASSPECIPDVPASGDYTACQGTGTIVSDATYIASSPPPPQTGIVFAGLGAAGLFAVLTGKGRKKK